ncbi:MAG: SDR family NAD(P)-dependent oxidoreductase, partial [Polyangiales bacterium]
MKFGGRTVLLTGGGTGIGRALARQLADEGGVVLICGRRAEPLEETAAGSDAIHPYRCDLTNSEEVESMLAAIERDGHRVDTLISNAAIFGFASLAGGLDLNEAKQIIDANLVAPIELTQRMLESLRRAEDPLIVVVGSPAGLGPLANTPIYSSSKAGLHAYT